jgi:zinc protease
MNKISHLILFVLFLAIAPFTACAEDTLEDKKFLDIQQIETASGIKIWLVEDHSLPIISVDFAFRNAGAKQDPADKQGLSILASNTMDEGAGQYNSEAFQQLLADHSISLRFASGRDDFSGSLKTLSRKKDIAFELLELALTTPRFDAEPLERMRAANLARIQRSRAKPEWMAARLMNDIAYGNHPYAQNSGGTLTTLQNITADDLNTFVKDRLALNNLVIAVVGDITPEDLSQTLENVFGKLPKTAALKDIPDLTLKNTNTTTLYAHDIPQTIIRITQAGIDRDDPDFYTASIMNYILGGSGFGSRLMEEIREKRGLTYGIYSGLSQSNHIDTLNVSTSTKNETTREMLDLIKAEWQKMKNQPVTEAELADAKSYLIGSMPLSLSSTDNISSLLLGLQLDGLPIDYLDQRADKINAVTQSDISRVAAALLTPDQMITILVGTPENITPTNIVETLPNVD